MRTLSSPTTDAPADAPIDVPATVRVTVRFFAGAKAAAGRSEETAVLPAGAGVADTVDALVTAHGGPAGGLARVLAASSFLVDGVAVHDRTAPLAEGAVLDVLPPFAGG